MKNYRKRVKKVNVKDRLSDLHDDILIHILSFIDVKSAAQACVLSRRWNNKLWMHHQDVYLNSKTSYRFEEFVDMVLTQRDKLHQKICSFTFTWKFKSPIPQVLFEKVHAHVEYHDVQHFDLSIPRRCRYRYHLFQKFNPKSLTTLRLNLSNRYSGSLCTNFDFKRLRLYLSGCTSLKTLWLEKMSMMMISTGVVDLFSSLVDLTELHIIGCFIIGRFSVGAPILEGLTLENNLRYPHLDISSSVLKYLKTDLRHPECAINQVPRYIEELEIDFLSSTNYMTNYRGTADHAKWLINQIRCLPHAKSVTLPKSTLQVISDYLSKFRVPVTLPQFKWELLKVITTNELPTQEFPEYRPGLAALTKSCSETLKVEFV